MEPPGPVSTTKLFSPLPTPFSASIWRIQADVPPGPDRSDATRQRCAAPNPGPWPECAAARSWADARPHGNHILFRRASIARNHIAAEFQLLSTAQSL